MTVARGPLLVALVALILRLLLPAAAIVFGGSLSRFITPDTASYLTPARHLLERGAFSNLSGPEIFRTPGYPLALTPGLIAGHPILVTLLLQALAGTLTVWFTMRTAALLFGDGDDVAASTGSTGSDGSARGAASIGGAMATTADSRVVTACGWLAACEPLSLVCGALLMADTLLTTAVSGAVLLAVMHLRQPSTRTALALGVALAAAAYIKPIAYYLPAVLIPWLWFEQRRVASRRPALLGPMTRAGRQLPNQVIPLFPEGKRGLGGVGALLTRHLLATAATVAILCGAWQIRNGMQTGFWGFSTLTARAVYVAAGGGVTAARDGRSFGDVREERLQHAAIRTSREPLHVGDMYRRGLSDVLASPGIAVAVHLKGMLLTLFDPASLDYLRLFGAYPETSPVTRFGGQGLAATVATIAREYPAVVWCSLLLEAILLAYLALAARGVWRALRHRVANLPEARVLLLIAAYFLVLSGGIFGTARFRLPIMPVVILLGGYALATRQSAGNPIPVGYTEPA
jgi:hypothetical protein